MIKYDYFPFMKQALAINTYNHPELILLMEISKDFQF